MQKKHTASSQKGNGKHNKMSHKPYTKHTQTTNNKSRKHAQQVHKHVLKLYKNDTQNTHAKHT